LQAERCQGLGDNMGGQGTLDPQGLIYKLRDLREAFPFLGALETHAPDVVNGLRLIQKDARDYGERYISPVAMDMDRMIGEDHSYFSWDIVKAGLPYRFLSYIIPKAFGGMGFLTAHFAVLMEELCSFCPGVANIFGAHALGLGPVLFSFDLSLFDRYMREVAEEEKKGSPVIFALAITEPTAGSDVEDSDSLKTARLVSHARRVSGGYILNGRKVFISNGSIAKYIWTGAVLDRSRPVETGVSFVIPSNAKGFSVGRVEKKMGQRACPAAELVFEDVFVPEIDRVGEEGEGERQIAVVLGASRAPVGAIATGIARGAFERLLRYVSSVKVKGKYLFEEQRIKVTLVDLMARIQLARQAYMGAALFNDAFGPARIMQRPIMRLMEKLPQPILRFPVLRRFVRSRWLYRKVKEMAARHVSEEDIRLAAAHSSLAKFCSSDLAMDVCSKAVEIMGPDGPLQEYGIEKCFRDAKLTQIYEGTNQINRLYVFKNALLP